MGGKSFAVLWVALNIGIVLMPPHAPVVDTLAGVSLGIALSNLLLRLLRTA